MLHSSAGLEESSATEAAEVEKEVATLDAEVETLQQKVSPLTECSRQQQHRSHAACCCIKEEPQHLAHCPLQCCSPCGCTTGCHRVQAKPRAASITLSELARL